MKSIGEFQTARQHYHNVGTLPRWANVAAILLCTLALILSTTPGTRAIGNPAGSVSYVVGSHGGSNSSAFEQYTYANLDLSRSDPAYAFNRTFFSLYVRVPRGFFGSAAGGPTGAEITTNLWINRAARTGGGAGPNSTTPPSLTGYVDIQRVISIYFDTLVEFRDVDGNGILSSADSIISSISLSEASKGSPRLMGVANGGGELHLDLNPSEVSPQGDNPSRGTLDPRNPAWNSMLGLESDFTITTPTARLTVRAYAFLKPVEFQKQALDPSRIKLDIQIDHLSRTDSYTALVMRVRSRDIGIVHLNGVDWGGLKADSRGVSAFFTWAQSAIVDGRTVQIGVATQDVEDGSSRVSFAYPPGASIQHDPQLGFDLATASQPGQPGQIERPGVSMLVPLVLAIAGVSGGLALVVWVRVSSRRKGRQ